MSTPDRFGHGRGSLRDSGASVPAIDQGLFSDRVGRKKGCRRGPSDQAFARQPKRVGKRFYLGPGERIRSDSPGLRPHSKMIQPTVSAT
jgi:hypothetical protein